MRDRSRPSGKGTSGAVLYLLLIVVVYLMTFGSILVSMVFTRQAQLENEVSRVKAVYLAEAGLSQALHELKTGRDGTGDGVGNVPPTPLGGGAFSAVHDPRLLTITATGECNGVRRTLQLTYSGKI